ncbi:MAG TPA: hypothetical protein VHX52_09930 [Steroidobacteraceae bacterium]|nr:hypothetical protein [Steroidobacteraceae bacterium]
MAKQRIQAGELPCNPSRRMWGSRGTGAPCSLCGRPIRIEEVEYEIEVPDEGKEQVLRFHLACHSIWHSECVRGGSAAADAH